MSNYNPIKSIDGTPFPYCPSSYQWDLEDISKADAGRTEDTNMDKGRIGQLTAATFSWKNVPTEVASVILQAFNPEYIQVELLDPMAGGYVNSEYYVGNRQAVCYNCKLGLWENISFKIIKRKGR